MQMPKNKDVSTLKKLSARTAQGKVFQLTASFINEPDG